MMKSFEKTNIERVYFGKLSFLWKENFHGFLWKDTLNHINFWEIYDFILKRDPPWIFGKIFFVPWDFGKWAYLFIIYFWRKLFNVQCKPLPWELGYIQHIYNHIIHMLESSQSYINKMSIPIFKSWIFTSKSQVACISIIFMA